MKVVVIGVIMMVVFLCCASLGSVELDSAREIDYQRPEEVVFVPGSNVVFLSALVTELPTFVEDSFDSGISLDRQGFYSLAEKIKRLDH